MSKKPRRLNYQDIKEVTIPDKEESKETPILKGVIFGADLVNLRTKPTMDCKAKGMLKLGAEVEVLEDFGDFYKVKTKHNYIGYVSSKYLKVGK